jgi:hypothetical protein
MKINQELLVLLLMAVEGEEPKPDVNSFTEEQRAYHYQLLIDNGLITGNVLRMGGRFLAAPPADTFHLTSGGQAALDSIRKGNTPQHSIGFLS